jgi:hypothetical protein
MKSVRDQDLKIIDIWIALEIGACCRFPGKAGRKSRKEEAKNNQGEVLTFMGRKGLVLGFIVEKFGNKLTSKYLMFPCVVTIFRTFS